MEYLGERIKQLRSNLNMSQCSFGKRLGISGKAVSSYERGKVVPPSYVLEKITDIYEVSLLNLPSNKKREIIEKIHTATRTLEELKKSLESGLSL